MEFHSALHTCHMLKARCGFTTSQDAGGMLELPNLEILAIDDLYASLPPLGIRYLYLCPIPPPLILSLNELQSALGSRAIPVRAHTNKQEN